MPGSLNEDDRQNFWVPDLAKYSIQEIIARGRAQKQQQLDQHEQLEKDLFIRVIQNTSQESQILSR